MNGETKSVREDGGVYRVNARFDADLNDKLTELAKSTGLTTSDVLREAVIRMHAAVNATQLAARDQLDRIVGRYSTTEADLSTRYKDILSNDWPEKHGQ
jgi:predicted DNA-binding protein